MNQVSPAVTLDDVRRFLVQQTSDTLVDIIMRQARDDDRMREFLLMRVAGERTGGPDVATFRCAIDLATETRGFVDYRSSYGFALGIDNVLDSIAQLLEAGHAEAVIELSEHALGRSEQALGMMDDSGGEMSPLMERIQDLHHAACEMAGPDPEELAHQLFGWELRTDWDSFYGAAERYADVLGLKGLAVYRELAEAEWKKLPHLGPGEDRSRGYESSRFRVTSIMEALARIDGDVEELVLIKSHDLSSPYRYLQIAKTYKDSGEADDAMRWAEDGIKAFPDRPDERLRDFLADEYHSRLRSSKAMALIWANFVERPDLSHYEELKRHATRAEAWDVWGERALAHLREAIRETRDGSRTQSAYGRLHADHSVLVQVFLFEEDPEAAWNEATLGGCDNGLWMKLAGLREEQHPADAMNIYQQMVEPIIDGKKKRNYRSAVNLIRKIGDLMARLGREDDFPGYVESVRDAHRRKRNLMALMDGLK